MQNQPIAEDEIDLKELIKTLWNKRKFIVVFTLAATLCSLGYVVMTQPNPVYQGSVLVEIGETQSENFGSNPLDEVGNLVQVLSATLNVTASSPRGASQIIELTKTGLQKQAIQRSLEEAVDYILTRHQEKAAFYANVIPTKQIGDMGLFKILCQSGKILTTQGLTHEDRSRRRAVCS